MISKIHTLTILSLIILAASVTHARSVYVINDTEFSQLQAYKIEDTNLILQADYICRSDPCGSAGAVGLAIDESEYGEFLFITFEHEDKIELVNAKTMQYIETVTVPQASNLVGIVVDKGKSKVYTVNRYTNHLYIYSWNRMTKELTLDIPYPYYVELQDCSGAYGLAFDEENDRLYVCDRTTTVKCYDSNDPNWSKLDDFTFTVTDAAIGIAIDIANQYVYTGNGGAGGVKTYLSQYDLLSSTETRVNVTSPVLGIAVDQKTSLVYITTFETGSNPDRLIIYDSNLVKQQWDSGDIGNPAGVAVGSTAAYKPPAFYLEKVDVNEPNCVLPGDYITYKITYGPNGLDHDNVVITDYLPCQVDYINPVDPNYDDVNHTYKWQIGSLSASAPNDFVMLTVYVNFGVEPNGIITNYCEIDSDHYYSFASADTNVCFWSPDIIYVDVNAVGYNSGLSWYHADPNLQRALQKAQAWDVNQIRVAEGMYKPTDINDTSARPISFDLVDGVAVYGGFPPGGGTWIERNPNTYETILSGDIGIPVDQNDNSYHVVKCQDVNNAVLDGFIITAGNADATYPDPNCYGGGIYCEDSNNLALTNCNVSDNSAYFGGALYNESSDPKITNCIFTGNTVTWDYSAGAGIYNYQSSPSIINCTFSGNSATGEYSYGGAIYITTSPEPNVTNCTFSNNSAREGGAVYNYDSDPNITNCIFTNNTASDSGGGMYNYQSSGTVANCIFIGNTSEIGGGIHNYDCLSVIVANCIFSGNSADDWGGGIANSDNSNLALTNCTFSGNWANYGGGICCWSDADTNLTNCILWDNEAITDYDEIFNSADLSVTYCDVKGCTGADANINEDPCFFEVEQSDGSWTDDASYDNSTFQSTMTDSGADWTVNELAGKFVNPYTDQYLQFFIVSNDVDTIKVWSDVRSIAGYGDTYQIYDYHLTVDSACIDAGDPDFNPDPNMTDIDGEPRVFDGDANGTEIVDMGADEYYWSPADFNSDGFVNFFDYAFFASAWLTIPTDQYYNEICDLVDNNCIDSNDLARFCEDWLWQTAWAKAFPFSYGRGMGKSMSMGEGFFPSIQAKQARPELTAADIEQIIKWLAELWLIDDDVRKTISEDEWLKFIESVKQVLKQLTNN
jgi:predicted outer membrane repeat protein